MKKILKTVFILAIILIIVLSSTIHTIISKRNLEVQTKMSNTIWLEPVDTEQKTIFVKISNTSDKDLDIESKVLTALKTKGYKIVKEPSEAKYSLQVNILNVEKSNLNDANGSGFSEVFMAAGIGSILATQSPEDRANIVGLGMASATLAKISSAFVKDVVYAMITDVLVSEKIGKNVQVTTVNTVNQGISGTRTSTSSETSDIEKYSTRVLSTANKVNLKFENAMPVLEDELVKVITGIF